ncbi:MAG TPA: hypothetical protein PLM14_16270 [Candidatus Hydrogenedentes bacterium]|nr:hypothetical protein [Candidatus Hydrogenedentota bacterium]HQE84557.1 hypothetical protein [Candidatus Hydrogenedentota bacterium]HQH54858.1 hypothetical protein [Candidatus Hydrogenedentota bacterium]
MNTKCYSRRQTACLVPSRQLLRASFTLCAVFIVCASSARGSAYYVSNKGSDDADGKSPQSAWASLNHVSDAPLQPGDSVLFERGGGWRGTLIPQNGSLDAPITYGAYGEGSKPLLMGSLERNDPADWEDMGNNIWAAAEPQPGNIELLPNGSFAEGLASWTTHTESGAVVEVAQDASTFDSAPAGLRLHCVQGATLGSHVQLYTAGIPITRHKLYQVTFRARCSQPINIPPPTLMERNAPWSNYGLPAPDTVSPVGLDWSHHRFWYSAAETSNDARLTFFLGHDLPAGATLWLDSLSFVECSGEFFKNDVGNIIFDQEASVGVKVWNREELDTQGEFWFDKNTWRLYLFSIGNPAERYSGIECAVNKHIINQTKRCHIIYENLALKYGAAHGIGGGDTHHIIVRDCEFSYIGGGELGLGERIVRFGNAVEFWGPAHDNLVERCRIWQIYDTGLSNQSGIPNTEQYNIAYRNNVVWNCEWLYEYWSRPENSSTHDIYFENNICAFAGFGWGHAQRSDPHGRNVGMRRTQAKLTNVFIRNNIFYESTQFLLDMAGWRPEEVSTVILDNNCWYQSKGTSFLFGDKTYDCTQFAEYQAESGKDAHSIWADPLFEDPANGDFRLTKDSPCLNKGMGIAPSEYASPATTK